MFDAVVLADSVHARQVLLGLTIAERGKRVASRVGARRVLVLDDSTVDVKAWAAELGDADLLVIRASDQMVHMPLVKPLLAASGARRVAVGPDGAYAGALYATGVERTAVLAAVAADRAASDTAIAAAWTDAERVPHGEIARHLVTTPAETRAARKLLLRILIKPAEDSPVSRYVYRPLSKPLTMLLLHTSITPNQISCFAGVIGLLGCWLTAQPSQTSLIWGAALVFVSGIIDGCDGEIARLRLSSSPFGAWLDTVIDELTTFAYFVAIGYHTYLNHPEGWVAASIAIIAVCYVSSVYTIYFFGAVVLKAGGSQYYQGDLEIIDTADGPALRPRPKPPSKLPQWVQTVGQVCLWVIRRDFINVAALFLTLVNLYWFIYGGVWVGAVITALIILPEHFRLRRQLRELARRGGGTRYVAA